MFPPLLASPPPIETLIKNFRVYSIHQEIQDLVIQVPFNPDHVFIINQTPATLYLWRGGNLITPINGADMVILPQSYYNFKPNFGGYLYAAHLEYPPGYVDTFPYYQCQILFYEGSMNLAMFPKPEIITPLNPLPDLEIAALFGAEIVVSNLCQFFDFTVDDGSADGWEAISGANTVYAPGEGWQQSTASNIVGIRSRFQDESAITHVEVEYSIDPILGELYSAVAQTLNDATVHQTDNDLLFNDSGTLSTFDYSGDMVNGFQVTVSGANPITGQTTTIHSILIECGGGGTGAVVQFQDLSTPLGEIAAWQWDFGDGSPFSTEQNPLHTYTDAGVYTVQLCVWGAFGGFACASADLYINAVADEVFDFV